ncbi:NAD(P)H-dependent glycerol-3-phosphate dehydrogenase [Alicyclobacillus shizuokensis]|uniref:NAD(P)H-dependent glycerol-3-phosphate dehydrogenase n=1 Tax=Alicyclobacillus shizuokensis TaxID=392014 RepID=UPI0008356E19|nr:NAD(P)H-dependent glycerol-3-phosphate dehydrogenase [Alicyclobacillus shizuokensis]MCL6625056.1 NAD(P)H-dependent glycerol-3-phosphate dehydrogenase [Alicyclobacillus shizuokensis]
MKIAVLGAGSWGTALAAVFARNGHETYLWARCARMVDEINQHHRNRRYLGEAELPVGLRASVDLESVLAGAEIVLYVVPSAAMAEVLVSTRSLLPPECMLAHAVKGFDPASHRRMSTLMQDLTGWPPERVCAITGPSHAEEVIACLPTTIVAASTCRSTAEQLQDALMNSSLRVYTNPDIVGAEIGGSLKNIIALAVGVADGLGFGDNARAALMTRGMAEIIRLGVRLGAAAMTFAGLSGIGDLIVTCTSQHSRNFRAGRMIGRGMTLDESLRHVGMVVEGVTTTRVAVALAAECEVEMPITSALHAVLFEGKNPSHAVEELMGRARSHEIEEVAIEGAVPQWLH